MQTISRVVEVGNPSYLSYKDRALRIERDGQQIARVPLEDLGVLVLDGHGIAVTKTLLAACADYKVAVVVCGADHMPAGLMLPIAGHTRHNLILRDQVAVTEETKAIAWQVIVQAKLENQSRVLKALIGKDTKVGRLKPFVRPGDPDNVEGKAASRYFLTLFDEEFVRARNEDGINAMLNYGYAVMRAAVARSICMAGMHPSLGIHHKNQYNSFALADDLMEPLRPFVDAVVWNYVRENGEPEELTPRVKEALLGVLTIRAIWQRRRYPILTAIGHYVTRFREFIQQKKEVLRCVGWMPLEE
jgi:CRISPR-associated protein Cas1